MGIPLPDAVTVTRNISPREITIMLMILLLEYALIVLVVALIAFCIGAAAYIHYNHMKLSHIPGPKRDSFLFGNQFVAAVAEGTISFGQLFCELHAEYGPVVAVFFLHFPIVSVVDPKTVKEVLLNDEYLKPRQNYEGFRAIFSHRFMGRGLVSELDHERWARHRRIINPAFHRKYLMELTDAFNESADRLVKYLAAKADGKTEVKVMHDLEKVTLDVICKVAFSMKGDMINNETPFSNAISVCLKAVYNNSSPLLRYDIRQKARAYRKEVGEAVKLLRDTGRNIIAERIADMQEGKELPKDILSYVINVAQAEESFTLEEMIDEFVTFFVAGQETTSNLLAFSLLSLGQNPHVLQKLLEEVDTVIGDKELIEYEDIVKLEYMSLVFKESLRLYPPVSGTARVISREMDVVGYKIPAGTSIFMVTFVMCRMEEYFKDPLTFDPERFKLDEDQTLYTYFPFSMGARSCIGQQFALIEARIILCKLLQKLSFQLVPHQDFGFYDQLTLKPKGGCANIITLRKKSM